MRPVIAYDVVRVCLAGVLLLAAGLKGYQLATEPVLGTGLLDSRWFLIAVVEFELFFGLWLLAGICPLCCQVSRESSHCGLAATVPACGSAPSVGIVVFVRSFEKE